MTPAAAPNPASRAATLVGFGAIALWSVLALLTASAGSAPPFDLAALTFAIGGVLRADLRRRARPPRRPPPALAGVARRRRRPIRLPRALFRGAATRPTGRGEPDRLSLAAADRAVLGAAARRAAAGAPSSRRRARLRRRRRVVRGESDGGGEHCARAGRRARLCAGALLRLRLVRLFGAVASPQGGADRGRRRLLPRHVGARRPVSLRVRDVGRAYRAPRNGRRSSASASGLSASPSMSGTMASRTAT